MLERHTLANPLLEAQVSDIWKQILVLDNVENRDSFAQLGGDSLAATLIAEQLQAHFSIEMTPGDVYANPTVELLAEVVRQRSEVQTRLGSSSADKQQTG